MARFEYKVIPAPRRGEKAKGSRTPVDRFAQTLTQMMNDLGRDGWEYQRAETLPCEERVGFTGKTTTFQNLLIFRRLLAEETPAVQVPASRHADGGFNPAALAASLDPHPAESSRAAVVLAPTVQAAEGQAPAVGPARGGLAAE